MEPMEEKLGAILNNPQMMQQIMSMAQALGQSAQPEPPRNEAPPPLPPIDPGMLQALSGIATQSGTNHEEQALLKALGPYLSRERVYKLEKAMRAAKLAALASTALGSDAVPFFSGR